MKIDFTIIASEKILEILPLLAVLNTKTPKEILEKRVFEMVKLPHYECAALYVNNELVGITCGILQVIILEKRSKQIMCLLKPPLEGKNLVKNSLTGYIHTCKTKDLKQLN